MVILNSMWARTGGQSRSYLNGGAQCKYEGSWACVCVPATFFYSFLPSSLPLSYTHANTQIYIHSPTRKKSLERGEIISHQFSTKNLTLQIKAIRVRKKDGEIQGGGDIEDGGKKTTEPRFLCRVKSLTRKTGFHDFLLQRYLLSKWDELEIVGAALMHCMSFL